MDINIFPPIGDEVKIVYKLRRILIAVKLIPNISWHLPKQYHSRESYLCWIDIAMRYIEEYDRCILYKIHLLETIPGGKVMKYLPNLIIRLDEAAKLKDDKDLGINGVVVDALICKSRTGRAGRSCQLVFDYDRGFDNDLSLFVTLRGAKLINNAGAYFSLAGYPDLKFTQKGFKDKLQNDPEFAKAFTTVSLEYLKNMINTDDALAAANVGAQSLSNSILSELNAGMLPQ